MKKTFSFALIFLLCPLWSTISLADRHGHQSYYRDRPNDHYRPAPYPSHRGEHRRYHPYQSRHHNDDWIVPLAIVGTALGVMAVSQAYNPPPPPPPRMCRDTYKHFDQYGRYLYSEYVERPCND